MTTHQDSNELNRPTDPAQLGADQGPGLTPQEDPQDMSTVVTDANDNATNSASQPQSHNEHSASTQASDFNQLRRQGAEGTADNSRAVGQGEGMGRAGFNGDEDRGYDSSGHRGGLGTSGGPEDLTDRQFDEKQNPFAGGYGGGNYAQPDEADSQRMGMNRSAPPANADAQQNDMEEKS
ncbi:hypothetical protein J0X19_06915 [Hymenobacter sp. BT186]|uniref:Uncharacterized protein n=1 Tax=Hymenobacter telluris TaxID=2816474 RepID=A0A939JA31_9BACT|nr:hypothetical protein [Hymenobacter telluris]MBO0357671.1 hypothetical protein [Hymenobacter telluris]MBW3373698.1 hypothetical protein [Hymenobacter norwichensis]